MVTEMSKHSAYLTPVPDALGRRYFCLTYAAVDFNDTELQVSDGSTNEVFGTAYSTVYFEGISLAIGNATAANVIFLLPVIQIGGHTAFRLPPWKTAYAGNDAQITPMKVAFPRAALTQVNTTYPQWFRILSISGYAATDACYMRAWGWIDAEPSHFRQPVTVEEVNVWPWRR